jgi:small subunit ribosomal protein S9
VSTDFTPEVVEDITESDEFTGTYTSESSTPATGGNSIIAPGGATGRRKEAVARVRIVPGTGKWTINGRELDNYFPNKVHQQLVNEPFRVTALEGSFDVIARIHGGGSSGQVSPAR